MAEQTPKGKIDNPKTNPDHNENPIDQQQVRGVATQGDEPRFGHRNMPIDNPESARFLTEGPMDAGRILPGVDGTRERVDPNTAVDFLHVSERRRKQWGIRDDQVLIAPRNPKDFDGCEVDRLEQMFDKYDSIRILKDEDGKPRRQGQHIYCVISREEADAQQALRDRAGRDFWERQKQGKVAAANGGELKEFKAKSTDFLEEEYARTHALLNQGILEKRPMGMTYEDVLRFTGREETLRLERRAAAGGREIKKGEHEEYYRRKSEELRAESRRGKRTYSLPGSPTR